MVLKKAAARTRRAAKSYFIWPPKTGVKEIDNSRGKWPRKKMKRDGTWNSVVDLHRWILQHEIDLKSAEKNLRKKSYVTPQVKRVEKVRSITAKAGKEGVFEAVNNKAKRTAENIDKIVGELGNVKDAFEKYVKEGRMRDDFSGSSGEIGALGTVLAGKGKAPFEGMSLNDLYVDFVWFHLNEFYIEAKLRGKRGKVDEHKKELKRLMEKYGIR